jgi:hypothetical protein
LQQKHKRYMASKVNYMQKKDIKKKLKWEKQLKPMKKKMLQLKMKNKKLMEQFQLIFLIEMKWIEPKFYQIWLNKKEKKKQENGKYRLRKLSQCLKMKCSK